MGNGDLDPQFKKTVTLGYAGRRLELGVAQDLFSSHTVDVGTRLLLRTLAGPEHASRRLVLDLGCGYGPIGLGLQAAAPQRAVQLVDRDALAVEYSRENAARNHLDDVEVYGSLGYADVRTSGFDLIVSNIPAKAGAPVIAHLLLDAAGLLATDGLVAIVVTAPIQASVAAILEGSPAVEIVYRRATASYAVFHYRFQGQGAPTAVPGDASGLEAYERQRLSLDHKGIRLRLRTAWGLPEFDSLSFTTELVREAILRLRGQQPRRHLVLHPGQGYLPSMLWAAMQPDELRLVDRDLLALRFSEANAVANGCPPDRVRFRHRPSPEPDWLQDADLVVAMLRPKEPPESNLATARQLLSGAPRGGRLVLAASSTAITRCLTALEGQAVPFGTVDRRRHKGFSVVVLERR